MTQEKYAQILFGPSDSAKEEYLNCACIFFEQFESSKEKISIINLDPFCEINPVLFDTDIRDSMSNKYPSGNSDEMLSFQLHILEKVLGNRDWFLNAFEGPEYFIINAPKMIEVSAYSSIYDNFIHQLLDSDFRIVFVNAFPASLITSPSTLISAKMAMLSFIFSLNCPKLPFVSVFTEVNSLNEENSAIFHKLISDDLENRDELLENINSPEEISGITSAICEFLASTENFAVIDSLDTEDDKLVESFFNHIDELLGHSFEGDEMYPSDDYSKNRRNKPPQSKHDDDNEEEDILFTTQIKRN